MVWDGQERSGLKLLFVNPLMVTKCPTPTPWLRSEVGSQPEPLHGIGQSNSERSRGQLFSLVFGVGRRGDPFCNSPWGTNAPTFVVYAVFLLLHK